MEREVKFIQTGPTSGLILFSEGGPYPQHGQGIILRTASIHATGIYHHGEVHGLSQLPKPNEGVYCQFIETN